MNPKCWNTLANSETPRLFLTWHIRLYILSTTNKYWHKQKSKSKHNCTVYNSMYFTSLFVSSFVTRVIATTKNRKISSTYGLKTYNGLRNFLVILHCGTIDLSKTWTSRLPHILSIFTATYLRYVRTLCK